MVARHGGLYNLTAGALAMLINTGFAVESNLLDHTVTGCAGFSSMFAASTSFGFALPH